MEQIFRSITRRLEEQFDPELLATQLAGLLIDLVTAFATFAVFYLVWYALYRVLHPLLKRSPLDETASAFLETSIKYVLLALGAVAALGEMGINTASLLTSLGIAGLTIGFAARDALSNIISGIFIFWDRPFVIGDLIEVAGHYGRVGRITMRSTRVVTVDGKELAIPNSTIVNSTVASYTNFPHVRVDVQVTIGVEEEIDRARELILERIREDPSYLETPEPRVVVLELGDYNMTLEAEAWVKDERAHIAKRLELREKIFTTLRDAGINMPLETLRLAPLHIERFPDRGLQVVGMG